MPEICRFYGITIKVFHRDHPPPHFHAEYGGEQAVFEIETLSVLAGGLRSRAARLVEEWAELHREELRRVWQQAQNLEPLDQIDPLP